MPDLVSILDYSCHKSSQKENLRNTEYLHPLIVFYKYIF